MISAIGKVILAIEKLISTTKKVSSRIPLVIWTTEKLILIAEKSNICHWVIIDLARCKSDFGHWKVIMATEYWLLPLIFAAAKEILATEKVKYSTEKMILVTEK